MAGTGGKRPGAGRKKGSKSKRPLELVQAAAAQGILPLDYMLRIMRDDYAENGRRDEMAKAAAPYLHSKMPQDQNHTMKGSIEHKIITKSDEDILEQYLKGKK